jgi:hypothetical protein
MKKAPAPMPVTMVKTSLKKGFALIRSTGICYGMERRVSIGYADFPVGMPKTNSIKK